MMTKWEIIRFHRLVFTTEKALLVEYQDGSQRWIPRSICKKVIQANNGRCTYSNISITS